jgi:hypothetical protein
LRGVSDRWQERQPLLRQCLKRIDADVLCFQECLTGRAGGGSRAGTCASAQVLAMRAFNQARGSWATPVLRPTRVHTGNPYRRVRPRTARAAPLVPRVPLQGGAVQPGALGWRAEMVSAALGCARWRQATRRCTAALPGCRHKMQQK